MPTYYHNPENALKRANEFCELGKVDEALECLSDALKNRKCRIMKQTHECIITKFLELCVELKKSQMAKDGLYCYRNLCQSINIRSWEDAVRKYLQLAESKVEKAQEKFQSLILDVDDLDQDMTPEILLRAVSSEGPQERTERITLLPWVKFLWECHRNCLDLLRNAQTEKLYHCVAQNAFKFCVKFFRRSELRKLCSVLKVHSIHIQKRHLKTDDFEVQPTHLETAFVELDSAMSMELWQDAFRALEDIHSLIGTSKKLQQSKVMAHYYDKIALVFWKGEDYLFHASAVLRLFLLVKDQKKNLNSEETSRLASRVLLSVLAVPLPPANPVIDLVAETDINVIDKKLRLLSTLLDLNKYPTRASLIKDISRLGIIQLVPREFQDLFQAIENDLEPTNLHLYISAVNDYINNCLDYDLKQYIPFVRQTAAVKLLYVLSKMYTSIKFSTLMKFTGFTETTELETVLVTSARRHEFLLRIDQRNMCVHFPTDFNVFREDMVWDESESKIPISNKPLKCLMYMHSQLKKAVNQIHPEGAENEKKVMTEKLTCNYLREREVYRRKLLRRKNIIEKQKECLENLRLQKEEEEKKRMAKKISQYEAAEKERLLRETEERNLQRLRREQEETKKKILIEKMETIRKTALGSQIIETLEDLDNLDPQILFNKQIEQLNRERKEFLSKLRRQEKNYDHLERAKRIEEIPLLIHEYNEKKKTDVELWKIDQRNILEIAHKERNRDLQNKKRVLEMKEDLYNFLSSAKKRQADIFIHQMQEFNETLAKEKAERLKTRANNRKQQRKDEWRKEQELQKKRALEILNNKQNIYVAKRPKPENKSDSVKMNILDQGANFATHVQTLPSKGRDYIYSREYTNSRMSYSGSDAFAETHNSKDILSFKKVSSSRHEPVERTEALEMKTPFHSEFSSEAHARSGGKNFRSYQCSINNQKLRPINLDKSKETAYSWRNLSTSSTSNKGSAFPNQGRRSNTEDEFYSKTITILKRGDSTSETSVSTHDKQNTTTSDIEKSGGQNRDGTSRSCTPWAKLKRLPKDQ